MSNMFSNVFACRSVAYALFALSLARSLSLSQLAEGNPRNSQDPLSAASCETRKGKRPNDFDARTNESGRESD
uniref:Putative secreted protein n=1 Tax=Anopheles darlingi TaxID=43151 RepID=A0A2M4DD18_ANODA